MKSSVEVVGALLDGQVSKKVAFEEPELEGEGEYSRWGQGL